MEELRPPVRCPRCNALPSWREVRGTERRDDPVGRLGPHAIIGWVCSNDGYFLPVSQWES
jgi:hypothetical protein